MASFIFCLFGTGGDLLPCVPVARALAERGHRVTVAANPHFSQLFAHRMLEFVGIGSASSYLNAVQDPRHWRGRGILWALQAYLGQAVEPVYRLIESRLPQQPFIVATGNAFGAHFARQAFGVKLYQPLYAPAFYISPGRLPYPYRTGLLGRSPAALQSGVLSVMNHLADRQLLPVLNTLRRDLGLAALKRYVPDTRRQWASFFPNWFEDLTPLGDFDVEQGRFVFHFADQHAPLPDALASFLQRGEAPVAVTFGTGVANVSERFERVAQVLARRGERGVFLSAFSQNMPSSLPPGIQACAHADLAALLPRCKLFVHHGGIGSVAQAMRAGVPQLVMPIAYDQPDNGFRVRALGLGDMLEGELSPTRIGNAMDAALASQRTRLDDVRGRLSCDDGGLAMACLFERLAGIDTATARPCAAA